MCFHNEGQVVNIAEENNHGLLYELNETHNKHSVVKTEFFLLK
jgi:hypothetical protein